jgi:TetR/AcrR family transcriptional regulator, transcriptional repressor for nem operon
MPRQYRPIDRFVLCAADTDCVKSRQTGLIRPGASQPPLGGTCILSRGQRFQMGPCELEPMKARLGRTRRNDPEGLRSRLLDTAANLFQERGYNATGMREIMAAIGVSSGALHHHFPTKEALAMAVIADRVAPAVRELWIEPVRNSKSLSKTVAEIFAGLIRSIERQGFVQGCPLNNLAVELSYASPQYREPLQAIFQEWEKALAQRLSGTREGAHLDRAQRSAAADFVIVTYSGAMNLAKASQSASPLRSAAATLAAWFREQGFAG